MVLFGFSMASARFVLRPAVASAAMADADYQAALAVLSNSRNVMHARDDAEREIHLALLPFALRTATNTAASWVLTRLAAMPSAAHAGTMAGAGAQRVGTSRSASFGHRRTVSVASSRTGAGYLAGDDREAPVIERDQVGQQFGAEPAPVTCDRIYPEPGRWVHGWASGGMSSMLSVRAARHRPRVCSSASAPKTARALPIMRAAPSGCRMRRAR